jgi:hypothetical protein
MLGQIPYHQGVSMNIYVDEAGLFVPPKAGHRYSLVLALIIPTANEEEVFYEFLRLRDEWPEKAVEIKGSKLNESQSAEVLRLLAGYRVIAEYRVIDMALHPKPVVDEFKLRQASALTEHLTTEHSDDVREKMHQDAEIVRSMANQLFVQAFITIDLILETLHTAINYFAQRLPTELGQFQWTIDGKDRSLTRMEEIWSALILPIGQARSAQEPFAKVEGFDYRHFSPYEIVESTADEGTRKHLEWMRSALPFRKRVPSDLRCIAASKILNEHRKFSDSRSNLGLQLADVVASTICRAYNGNLQLPGWRDASKLLVRKKIAPISQIGKAAHYRRGLESRAAGVWRQLDANSQAMVLE